MEVLSVKPLAYKLPSVKEKCGLDTEEKQSHMCSSSQPTESVRRQRHISTVPNYVGADKDDLFDCGCYKRQKQSSDVPMYSSQGLNYSKKTKEDDKVKEVNMHNSKEQSLGGRSDAIKTRKGRLELSDPHIHASMESAMLYKRQSSCCEHKGENKAAEAAYEDQRSSSSTSQKLTITESFALESEKNSRQRYRGNENLSKQTDVSEFHVKEGKNAAELESTSTRYFVRSCSDESNLGRNFVRREPVSDIRPAFTKFRPDRFKSKPSHRYDRESENGNVHLSSHRCSREVENLDVNVHGRISESFGTLDKDGISAEATQRKSFIKQLYAYVAYLRAKHVNASSISQRDVYEKAASDLKFECKKLATDRIGDVPGIETGEIFPHRTVLRVIGLHKPPMAGIAYLEQGNGIVLATSIVLSGKYEDDIDNGDIVIYTGNGGNDCEGSKRQFKDQTVTKSIRALVNNIKHKQPIRLIRSYGNSIDNVPSGSYRYDGLYDTQKCWTDRGISGFKVYKFKLVRQRGQQPLTSPVVRFVRGSLARRTRLLKADISEGREAHCMSVVNAVDDSQLPMNFSYIMSVRYPCGFDVLVKEGCKCEDCSDPEKCLCALRNGGDFLYNQKGIILQARPVLYECGSTCNCPPTCRNRVSQQKIRYRFEIYRTRNKEWGLRTLDFIEAGSFIAEYVGDIVADPCNRIPEDRYSFPISSISVKGNWGDRQGLFGGSVPASPSQKIENLGLKVDASRNGNVTRFMRRSHRSNVFAQYVLHDHHETKLPHVMLFASENISPNMELFLDSSNSNANAKRPHLLFRKESQKSRFGILQLARMR